MDDSTKRPRTLTILGMASRGVNADGLGLVLANRTRYDDAARAKRIALRSSEATMNFTRTGLVAVVLVAGIFGDVPVASSSDDTLVRAGSEGGSSP